MSTLEIAIIIINKTIKFSFFYFNLLGLISIGLGVIYMFSYLIINPTDISLTKILVFITLVSGGSFNIYYSRKFIGSYEKVKKRVAKVEILERERVEVAEIEKLIAEIEKNLLIIRRAFTVIFVSSLMLTILSVVWNFELYRYYLISPTDYYTFKFMIGFFIISFLGIFFCLSYISELYSIRETPHPF